ncbi:fibrinogen-like protein 1 [Mytilus trossulus]|uniref:fibrinogen-like protein 1 n=1 Tax=Mytilus trossulus TaxID=6551 RepID=UPI00300758F9
MLELKNRKYTVEINQEFVSTETAIGTGKVVSTTACASVCTSNDKCCTANYNTSTQDCNLNSCCIPDTRPSENGITIKRVAKPDEDDVKTKRMNCGDVCKGSGDGIYIIFPDGSNEGIEVYCELDDAYGWTVIQRRVDDSEDFNRSWLDYKHGFGNLSGNFWLGNANIHKIVAGTNHSLRVDIEDKDNKTYGADYHIFNVSDERSNYTLTIVDQSGKDAAKKEVAKPRVHGGNV